MVGPMTDREIALWMSPRLSMTDYKDSPKGSNVRRDGGVATQLPAKHRTPVRIRLAPLAPVAQLAGLVRGGNPA